MYKDQFRHPVQSLAAQGKLLREHPLKALSLDTKSAKALNEDTARRVAAAKAKKVNDIVAKIKREKQTAEESANEWREIAKYQGKGQDWLNKQLAANDRITEKNINKYQNKIAKLQR
jgi:hypothetical protein